MFRAPELTFWDAEKVIALYEGVLRRTPTADEIVGLVKALNKSGDVKRALQDMLSSHEFGIMMLPNLVNEHITRVPAKPLFFLHVPKTAGTSFRLDLSDALGIPAFLLFIHTSWPGYGKDEKMHFWPFWAGHAGISVFPATHRGITIFRETRSRILSLYRQQQRELLVKRDTSKNWLNEDRFAPIAGGRSAVLPFSEWLTFLPSASAWYLPAPDEADQRRWNGVPIKKFVDALAPRDLTEKLSESLTRFDAAAWAHDQQGMRAAIRRVTGTDEVEGTRRENVFRTVENTVPILLTPDDRHLLDDLASQEEILIKLAIDHGLIPPITKEEADEEFANTAKRLGFNFA